MSLPDNGRLGGSGGGAPQPADGKQPGTRQGAGRPKNLAGFGKAHASGSLANDLAMGRMGTSYMHNPAFRSGAEDQTNKPKQLPSTHIVEHGDDDHAIAHTHMDSAKSAKTTDEKRKHVFNALNSLNRAKKKGY